MKKIIEKFKIITIGSLSMIFLVLLILTGIGMCSCGVKIVPHNCHKEIKSREGMRQTEYGLIHKSQLKDIKRWKRKYQKL